MAVCDHRKGEDIVPRLSPRVSFEEELAHAAPGVGTGLTTSVRKVAGLLDLDSDERAQR